MEVEQERLQKLVREATQAVSDPADARAWLEGLSPEDRYLFLAWLTGASEQWQSLANEVGEALEPFHDALESIFTQFDEHLRGFALASGVELQDEEPVLPAFIEEALGEK